MKIKRRILNITFISLFFSTLVLLFVEVIQLKKESQQYHGHELLGIAVAAGVMFVIFTVLFCSELSIYFNFRYFLLCKNKTILKTVLNIVALVMNIGLGILLVPALNAADFSASLYLLFLALFVLLRVVTFFIPNGKASPNDA